MSALLPLVAALAGPLAVGVAAVYAGSTAGGRTLLGGHGTGPVPQPDPLPAVLAEHHVVDGRPS